MTWSRSLAVAALFPVVASAQDPRFAAGVVSSSNLGSGVYGDPTAALGKPTTWVRDTFNGGPSQAVAASLIYGAFGTSPTGQPLVVTILSGGQLTLEFNPVIEDSPANPYGLDFIVYGNSFLGATQSGKWNTDLEVAKVTSGPDFIEPSPISVSPDGLQWYTYPLSSTQSGDAYFPTQPFQYDFDHHGWGRESSWSRPVPPWVTRSSLTGLTVAQAIALFKGSAGGCAFDLAPSGFSWIRYVRITGTGGEIDGLARTAPPKLQFDEPNERPRTLPRTSP